MNVLGNSGKVEFDKYTGIRWLGVPLSLFITGIAFYIGYILSTNRKEPELAIPLAIIVAVIQAVGGALLFHFKIGGHIIYNLSYGAMWTSGMEILIMFMIGMSD